jgi:hypothetical protein
MTTSSASKDNPKGGKKATKPTLATSSSLKTIMKYGGNVIVGPKDVGKKNPATKGDKMGRTVKRGDTEIKEDDMAMEIGEVGNYKDIDMSLYEDEEVEIVGESAEKKRQTVHDGHAESRNYESMDTDSITEASVRQWEKEVEHWEKEMVRAATAEFRSMVEEKLHKAQLMLKEALLHMTMVEDSKKQESDDNLESPRATDVSEKGSVAEDNTVDVEGNDDTKLVESENKKNTDSYEWGDISDDDTVVQENQKEKEWETVTDKKHKKRTGQSGSTISKNEQKDQKNEPNNIGKFINNPYNTKKGEKIIGSKTVENINQWNTKSSLTSYLEIIKDNLRSENETAIRVNMSFTPRTTGYGELTRVAKELLIFGGEIDKNMLLLPWDKGCGLGPINLDDLSNPKNLGENIRKFFNKPYHVNFVPGSPAYGIGIHMSTNMTKYEFLSKWNLKKQEYKQNHRAAYSISLAPMQKSPNAYIIGIAVGSTEKQEYELLNEKLGKEIGIDGVEVSFQNINQAGVTQEFWKHANEKAAAINTDKYSRDHLREKFRWAPNALAIYVPTRELVNTARKRMLTKYGKPINGEDPIWSDGAAMRFLPIKGPTIKNERTRTIVRKRMAYHIWLKANELSIDTNFMNIHQTIDAFEGKTFAEVVLQSVDDGNKKVFTHINRAWSNVPSEEKWSLSIKSQLQDSAMRVYGNLKDRLTDKYGQDIERFFFKDRSQNSGWRDALMNTTQTQEDDDDWFDDDEEIEEVVKKGLIDSTFLHFFSGNADEDDKESVASWGTGNTAYTEIVMTKETGSTGTSSITNDSHKLPDAEIEKRRDIVRVRLKLKNVPEEEIDDMMERKPPYELAFSGVHLPTWEADKEVFMLLAFRDQFKPNQLTK